MLHADELNQLGDVLVPVGLTYRQCLEINGKLRQCGCENCLALWVHILHAMSDSVLETQLAPELTSLVDQALARDKREAILGLLTVTYMERVISVMRSRADIELAVSKIHEIVVGLDISLPLDELKTLITETADSHAATWGLGQ